MTNDAETRPRKLLAGRVQWGVAYKDAARGDEDLCMGTVHMEGWEQITAQIVAVPLMLEALRRVANESADPSLKALAKRALKAAGTR
jgi:hypothetical protein